MTVKSCEKLEKSRVALTIETSAEEFEAAVNKAYLKMRGKINVPGFRVGKAPRKIIEKMYGAEVFYEEAVNIILPDAYEAAVKEQELEVVGYPQVELESCTKDGVVFKCTVAVYPEVKLGQYKGLEAPKAEVKVVAADVNARLKEMADRNSRLVSVERAVKKGDTADIDFEGFDNGVAFDGGKGENFDLEIGSGSFVPGFEDQLIGMKAGEEKSYSGSFDLAFYLEKLGDGTDMAARSNALRNSWENYQISPSNSKEENLAKIDAVFGETSPYAALWRSIYLAGLTLNPCHQYSIGQFDYTPASGWLYSIGGETFYPGTSMSNWRLKDHDTLVLRYTLAGGRDVGDAGAAGSKDTAAGNAFCVTAINGSLTVAHQWTTVVNEDGTEQKVCASCGKIEACSHTKKLFIYHLS